MYYWAKLYQGQLQSGQSYKEHCRIVTINVLAFSFLPDIQNHDSISALYDIKTGYRLNRDIEVHFLELPPPIVYLTSTAEIIVFIHGKYNYEDGIKNYVNNCKNTVKEAYGLYNY